jgi:hypothetical protein
MTTSITCRTELAHRANNGIDVYLFWNEQTNHVTVGIVDARTDESFEFEVDGPNAFDAFSHPYAYATQGGTTGGGLPHGLAALPAMGSDSQGPAVNQWRSDHASTDR